MNREEGLNKLRALLAELPEVISTQQIIIAFHNAHGGKDGVAALCRAFGVRCAQGNDICGTCATHGMNAAMEEIADVAGYVEGNAPSTRTAQ